MSEESGNYHRREIQIFLFFCFCGNSLFKERGHWVIFFSKIELYLRKNTFKFLIVNLEICSSKFIVYKPFLCFGENIGRFFDYKLQYKYCVLNRSLIK